MSRKLLRLLGVRSPSEWCPTGGGRAVRWADLGEAVARGWAEGIEKTSARRAELLASGMTPDEAQAVLWRELALDPGFPVMLARAETVARRSLWSLYEDEEEG